MAFTYIARCADDTLYVGHAEDLVSREEIHNRGHGAKYTASRLPVRIIYAEEHSSLGRAVKRERQLKRWSREKKEALIRGDRKALDWLSHRSVTANAVFTWSDLVQSDKSLPSRPVTPRNP